MEPDLYRGLTKPPIYCCFQGLLHRSHILFLVDYHEMSRSAQETDFGKPILTGWGKLAVSVAGNYRKCPYQPVGFLLS